MHLSLWPQPCARMDASACLYVLHMCMYVCMYIYIYTHTYTHAYVPPTPTVCLHACIYGYNARTYMHTHLHTTTQFPTLCLHVRIYQKICSCIHSLHTHNTPLSFGLYWHARNLSVLALNTEANLPATITVYTQTPDELCMPFRKAFSHNAGIVWRVRAVA